MVRICVSTFLETNTFVLFCKFISKLTFLVFCNCLYTHIFQTLISDISILVKRCGVKHPNIASIRKKTCPCKVYPLKPHFYIAKLGFKGYTYFSKHRLLVLVRTASCTQNLCFEQKLQHYQNFSTDKINSLFLQVKKIYRTGKFF